MKYDCRYSRYATGCRMKIPTFHSRWATCLFFNQERVPNCYKEYVKAFPHFSRYWLATCLSTCASSKRSLLVQRLRAWTCSGPVDAVAVKVFRVPEHCFLWDDCSFCHFEVCQDTKNRNDIRRRIKLLLPPAILPAPPSSS